MSRRRQVIAEQGLYRNFIELLKLMEEEKVNFIEYLDEEILEDEEEETILTERLIIINEKIEASDTENYSNLCIVWRVLKERKLRINEQYVQNIRTRRKYNSILQDTDEAASLMRTAFETNKMKLILQKLVIDSIVPQKSNGYYSIDALREDRGRLELEILIKEEEKYCFTARLALIEERVTQNASSAILNKKKHFVYSISWINEALLQLFPKKNMFDRVIIKEEEKVKNLITAVKKNDVSKVTSILTKGEIDINALIPSVSISCFLDGNFTGFFQNVNFNVNALMTAAFTNNCEMISILLNHNAN